MIEIAVVEDNRDDVRLLKEHLSRFFKESGEEFSVKDYETGFSFLDEYRPSYDLVFMDIELPDMSGMEVARHLRRDDSDVIIVFATNMAQFAVNGYAVNAFDFIVKPIDYYDFDIKMHRIISHLRNKNDAYVTIKTQNATFRRRARDIEYVEVMNHALIWHLESGEQLESRGKLGAVEKELTPLGFIMCNRCFLVNFRYIREITDNTVVVGSKHGTAALQIGRTRKKEFLAEIAKYFGRGGF